MQTSSSLSPHNTPPLDDNEFTRQQHKPRLSGLTQAGQEVAEIPVPINYDIIRLFSEGLYRSPHKAIEELVSNGYDAGARRVHVLLPEQPENKTDHLAPLWVIDDGHGMDVEGFRQLWRVAESNKTGPEPNGRAPIGQFGIGKLAAYVLAWKLTHLSCVSGKLRLTAMDFHDVTGRQNDVDAAPVRISLREVDEKTAKTYLAEIEQRAPEAWALMFDEKTRASTWTAAALSDFKDLYNQLSTGRLRWVLSTGLPLYSDFKISLNGVPVMSSKENLEEIKKIDIHKTLDGIGEIKGTARIHEKPLTTGKSEQLGRSHGFFIRVRGRVINLEDELFGVQQPNHAAWSRFALEVSADGLRDHLLSSREGVRDSGQIQEFRAYLLQVFNQCRTAYNEWDRKTNASLDMAALLSDSPSFHVTEPLFRSVRNTMEAGSDSFYIATPQDVEEEGRFEWLATYEDEISEKPFDKTEFVKHGPNAPALRYDPVTRNLIVNSNHPFIDKLTGGDKNRNPAELFASAEVLLEGQLQESGIESAAISSFLKERDRVLRLAAGDAPPTAAEVLRLLEVANRDRNALERATGAVFQILGFAYERKGGALPGPDGVLYAHLGRQRDTLADYKLVYDAKQTNHPSVPADKINLSSLEDFRKNADAHYGFFIATAYHAETDEAGKLNRQILSYDDCLLTLLKLEHLVRLVQLHYRHGVTLTKLRELFETAHTVPQVNKWMDALEAELREQGEVPLSVLLQGLEEEKSDPKATPNIVAVRAKNPALKRFEPERLVARLKAVESIIGTRWIEVDTSGIVLLHQSAEQLLAELERHTNEPPYITPEESPETTP